MKPILLEIQGINSFLDKQRIEFKSLLKSGLFGIFGKTGSGKTTILDAITLALYGEIPRYSSKEKKEFINSRTTTAYVLFEFQVESINYTVERSYKLKADNFIESTNTRLYKKNNNVLEILGDKVTDINEKIVKLVGLSYKDFTRIVVLPQGKFSDFLLLTNKDRNSMLERIFGLEDYGSDFIKKANALKKSEEIELESIIKQLETYDGVSRSKIKDVKKDLAETEIEVKNLKDKIDNLDKKIIIEKEFEKNFKNLDLYLEEKNALDNKEKEIKEKEVLFNKSKSAEIVYPIIKNINLIETDLNKTKKQLIDEQKSLNNEDTQFLNLKKDYEIAKNNKEENGPLHIEKIHNLKDAISYEEKLNTALAQKNSLASKKNNLENTLDSENEKFNIFQKDINNYDNLLFEINKRKKKIQVLSNFRTSIDFGFKILEEINENTKNVNSKKDALSTRNHLLELNNNEINKRTDELGKISTQTNIFNNKISDLTKKQISSNDLLLLNNEIIESKKNFLTKTEYKGSLSSLQKDLQEKENLLQITNEKLSVLNKKNNEAEENSKNLSIKIAKQEKENLVNIIIKDLHNGDECPVCGSEIKDLNITKESQNLKTFELERSDWENKIKDLDIEFSKHKTTFDLTFREIETLRTSIFEYSQKIDGYIFEDEDVKIKKSSALFEDKTTQKIEIENEIKNFESKIKKFENDKSSNEINIATLKEKINNDMSFISTSEKEVLSLENKIKENQISLLEISTANSIIDNNDYFIWNKKIKDFDIENENLDIKLNKSTNLINEKKKDLDNTNKAINSFEKELSNVIFEISENSKNISSFIEKIKSLSNNENLKAELLNTEKSLKDLIDEEKKLNENLDKTQKSLQKIKDENIKTKNNLENLEKDLIETQNYLNKNLEKYNFENYYIVKNFLLSEPEQNKILDELEFYKKKYFIVTENIKNIEKYIKNQNREEIIKSIIKDENTLADSNNSLEEKTKNLGEISANLKSLNKNIIKVDSLLEEKNKSKYQLDLLKELTALLRGNGFIKFITKNQLKYITFEASERFKKMTKKRYAFELDDTNFIVIDDWNNGVRRSPKTLSGGETFIASLCLALALSSKIQLNSKHPLEFFFLDEGFGTLDSSSLDQVVISLERLKTDKINIGIISHSKNLKERIPVRLLVDSPDGFGNGSRVKLEIH